MATERVYDHPELYDQAFAWRDYQAETAVIRELWRRCGQGPLDRILELACGTAPHAPEVMAAGIRYLGLDRSRRMLATARARAPRADLLLADQHQPPLPPGSIDLAMTLIGSLYVDGPEQLLQHLDRVAELVRPGGAYLLDWCVLFDDVELHEDEWTVDGPMGRAHVRYRARWIDRERGLIEEVLRIRRREVVVLERSTSWAITAEAFLPLVATHPRWRLAGCWNDWDPQRPLPLPDGGEIIRPVVVLTRCDGTGSRGR